MVGNPQKDGRSLPVRNTPQGRNVIVSRKVSRSRAGDAFVFLVLATFGLFMFFPFLYAIIQSFKPMQEIFRFPPRFWVENPTLENYALIPSLVDNLWIPFGRYVFNSVFVSVTGTALHILIVSLAAFPLAKYRFPGSRVYFEIIIISLLFTGTVTALPLYVLMAKTGMINTYLALLLPEMAAPFGLFLMKQFMSIIPDAILEAGQIDGANKMAILWRVVMPNVKPAWLTLLIFVFQSYWNGAGSGYIYSENLKLLPTALGQIATSGLARAGSGAAIAVLLMLPPLTMFVFSQSRIIETMAHSGIK